MYRFKNGLIALIGLISLVAISTVLEARVGTAAPAPSTQNVKVVNGITEPVPTTINGTVQAAQSGTWNVGISGTPTVSLSSGASVNVANTPSVSIDASGNIVKIDGSSPVSVQTVNQPFQVVFRSVTAQGEVSDEPVPLPGDKSILLERIAVAPDGLSLNTAKPTNVAIRATVKSECCGYSIPLYSVPLDAQGRALIYPGLIIKTVSLPNAQVGDVIAIEVEYTNPVSPAQAGATFVFSGRFL